MVPISIFDSLSFTPISEPSLTLDCDWVPGFQACRTRGDSSADSPWERLPAPQANLAWRAVALLRERSGVDCGGHLRIAKRIPAAAGLGGASSDAATALVLANGAWQLNWPRDRLAELAAELGSDVPFFLTREAAVCRGRGERIEQLGVIPRLNVVVVRPNVGLSTARVYGRCQVPDRPVSIDRITRDLIAGDLTAEAGGGVAGRLHNRLQDPATSLSPVVSRLAKILQQLGGVGFLMSGSGTSHFVLCWNHCHAQAIAGRLRSMGFGAVYQAYTL